jgi:hypothetical protein
MEALDVSRGENAEDQLVRFIDHRARQNGEERPEEVMYAESVRRYHSRRRKEIAAQWYAYHSDQAERLRRSMTVLVAFHEEKARQLLEEGSA